MHGHKPHKGLLKRMRLSKGGKVKVRIANGSHLRSGKPADQLRSFRKSRYIQNKGVLHRISHLLGRAVQPAGRAPASAVSGGKVNKESSDASSP